MVENMRIVFAGTPDVAAVCLQELVDSGQHVVGVLTRNDAPLGRKRVLTASPVAARAATLGLPVHKCDRPDEETADWVRTLRADVGVVVAYGAMLREPLLHTPRLGWVNLHFSHLPKWRGAAPVQRALMAGERELGMTVFRLVPELDAGDILVTETRVYDPGTSAGEVLEDMARAGGPVIRRALDKLARDPRAGEPQRGAPTYAHKLTRADGKLDPSDGNEAVLAHWAGVTPEPGAFVLHEGQPLKLYDVRAWPHTVAGEAGDVVFDGRAAILLTGDGALELVTVQPAGKSRMAGDAWLRGRGGKARVS